MIKEDLTNREFGRLTVLYQAKERSKKGYIQWVCQCSCENKTIIIVPSDRLRSKKTKSCGCLQKDIVSNKNKNNEKYPEEDRNTRLYRIWKTMIARTIYPSQDGFKNYGGRGIKVCEEWLDDFYKFKNWAMSNGYDDDLTIDRINCDGNYEPSNCKWSSRKEQNNNQRRTIKLTYQDITHNLTEWADLLGIKYNTLYHRYKKNYPIEKILKEYKVGE